MMAGLPEARLLEALIVTSGARSVLELGTFTALARWRWPPRCPQAAAS